MDAESVLDPALREDIINYSEEADYVAPGDPLLDARLEWFRDQKLAFMVHWGTYSQLGLCESWPLSDGDADWSREGVDWTDDPEAFRAEYWALNKTFNPIRFMPEQWADFAQRVGFRYLIFTTKHHDGFCMYDSRYSDYRITAPDCPFHAHKYADVTRHLFDAFRARGMGIAAYYSKPDWHVPSYWAAGQRHPVAHWRNPSYEPGENPALWEEFVQYAQGQMMELVEDYGPLDVLWLDGGWVMPGNRGQDIRMAELAARARAVTPGLLIADRTVGGPYENYITPEQSVPDHYISAPWESCVTIGTSFSFRYDDDYKTPRELVWLLTQTVGFGGNLALNIGAQPDGRLPRHAVQAAMGLGEWLDGHGEAIFGTRACAPYVAGAFAFTRKEGTAYAIQRLGEGETLGETALIPLGEGVAVTLLDGTPLEAEQTREGWLVTVPEGLRGTSPLAQVYVLR